MKDTILTARRKKTELITLFLFVSIIANLVTSLYSIFTYNTPFDGDDNFIFFMCSYFL